MTFPRIVFTLIVVSLLLVLEGATLTDTLITHEWGTLTSVAGKDGEPVRWQALLGPADLPCFVDRLRELSPKFSPAYVRMETPVLYFYSPRPVTISIGVNFPHGWITEWYPRATSVAPKYPGFPVPPQTKEDKTLQVYGGGEIRWDGVQVLPGPDLGYPQGKGDSTYYAARNTDSAPLRIVEQQEKLIFYRGIGDFQVPVRPAFAADGALEIRNAGSEAIPLAILFENRGGRVGYRRATGIQDAVRLPMPDLTGDLASLRNDLVQDLVEFGLYRAEAEAMLETWSDSWFEEGARVMYIVPRPFVDGFLPLEVEPAPTNVARVFVGRVELLSPWMRRQIETAAAGRDLAELQKFGRFLTAFAAQMGSEPASAIQEASGRLLRRQLEGPGCVQ
jgi:hypothetical protein